MTRPAWFPHAQKTTIAGFGILLCGIYLLLTGSITTTEFGGFVALAAPFLGISEHTSLPVVATPAGEAVVVAPVTPKIPVL